MCRVIIKKNWLDIEEIVNNIFYKIKVTEFKPDCIVGIARGGLVPAVMLAHKLECRVFGFIQFQRTKNDKPFSLYDSSNTLIGVGLPKDNIQKVLVVDDIIVEGIIYKDTIRLLQEEYGKVGILGAFLYKAMNCPSIIEDHDYIFSEAINNDEWIVYPWEKDPN